VLEVEEVREKGSDQMMYDDGCRGSEREGRRDGMVLRRIQKVLICPDRMHKFRTN